MNDFVCIPRRFPSAGLDGVLGVPVTSNAESESYLSALPVPVDDGKVRFVRLTEITWPPEGRRRCGQVPRSVRALS